MEEGTPVDQAGILQPLPTGMPEPLPIGTARETGAVSSGGGRIGAEGQDGAVHNAVARRASVASSTSSVPPPPPPRAGAPSTTSSNDDKQPSKTGKKAKTDEKGDKTAIGRLRPNNLCQDCKSVSANYAVWWDRYNHWCSGCAKQVRSRCFTLPFSSSHPCPSRHVCSTVPDSTPCSRHASNAHQRFVPMATCRSNRLPRP